MGAKRVTVKELIKQLKEMPQNARVVWKDHDHSEGEFNMQCRYAFIAEDAVCDELGEPHGNVVALTG